jgi:hypothetical protein
MVAWRWAEPRSGGASRVAGKLVGRGEPGARTARAGDELGAESPGMPVIPVINDGVLLGPKARKMVATCASISPSCRSSSSIAG